MPSDVCDKNATKPLLNNYDGDRVWVRQAANANDDCNMSDGERERIIKKLGKANGFDFVFEN